MKIINLKHLSNYNFMLHFENNEIFELDLESIMKKGLKYKPRV